MAEKKQKNSEVPAETDSGMVRVKVFRAIAIDGLRIAPKIDPKSHKVTPVTAVIPAERAKAHGSGDVKVIGEAPAGSKIGVVED